MRRSSAETYIAYCQLKKNNPDLTWGQAGKSLGMTRERVRQAVTRYERRALKAMEES